MAVGYGNWKFDPRYRKVSDFGKRIWPEEIPDKESMSYSRTGVSPDRFYSDSSFWEWFDQLSPKIKDFFRENG